MTIDVLFVQGGGEDVHDQWDDKLVESLRNELGAGYTIRYPYMPDEEEPHYSAWQNALQNEIATLTDSALLVGHSVGGTILIHTLADELPKRQAGGVFLIAAPFIGEGGRASDDIKARRNLGHYLPAGVPIFMYHGTDDDVVPYVHLNLYERAIPQAVVRTLGGRNHQLNNDLSCVAQDIRSLKSLA